MRKIIMVAVIIFTIASFSGIVLAKDMSGRFAIGYEREFLPGNPFNQAVENLWWYWLWDDGIMGRWWITPSVGMEGAFGTLSHQERQESEGDIDIDVITATSYAGRVFWKVIDRPNSHLYMGFGISAHDLRSTSSHYCSCSGSWSSSFSGFFGTGWEGFLGIEWFPAWPENVAISAEWGYERISYKPYSGEAGEESTGGENYSHTISSTPLKVAIAYYLGKKKD